MRVWELTDSEGGGTDQLQALIAWPRFTKRLMRLYRGKARQGRPPYDPAVILKMLLIAYLYDLSER